MRAARWLLLALCLPFAAAGHAASATPPAHMWDAVSGGGWTLVVRSIKRQPAPLIPGDESSRPTGQFAIFTIDLTNTTEVTAAPLASDFTLRSAQGAIALNRAAGTAERAFAVDRAETPFGDTVAPGEMATTLLVFDIPPSAFPLTLVFRPAGREIDIDECSCSLPSPSRPPVK
jgi:hypothetical protein